MAVASLRGLEDRWGQTEDGMPLRTLLHVKLVDTAPVINPAYLDTTSGMRPLAGHLGMVLDGAAGSSYWQTSLSAGRFSTYTTAPGGLQGSPDRSGVAASGVPSLSELRRRLDLPPPVKPASASSVMT